MQKVIKLLFISGLVLFLTGCSKPEKSFENSIGMSFVRIESGSFKMGETNKFNPEKLGGIKYLETGDYDEHPVHKVEISEPFYISTEEVTIEQFRQFRKSYKGVDKYTPYATGISWNDAVQFCKWLSEKEGKTYRLPTEAEWEYAAKAGSQTLFFSGDSLPDTSAVNNWGLKNVTNNIAEWVYDWYGSYPYDEQVDPVGRTDGFTKVIRGAGLDKQTPYYSRSANRASMPPNFPLLPLEKLQEIKSRDKSNTEGNTEHKSLNKLESKEHYKRFYKEESNSQGYHNIGLRIVQADMPDTEPLPEKTPFVNRAVIQNSELAKTAPDKDKPYFKRRVLLPIPPDNTSEENLDAIQVAGFDPGILRHNHSPALEVAPNGDVIMIIYTSVEEVDPDVALMETRLRFGADEWDMPEMFLDCADVDDHAPMLWKDKDTIRLFWGHNKLNPGFPFQWISSTDNGATWSHVNFPVFETMIGGHSAQPINTGFRDSEGNIHISSDAIGGESVLWLSTNNGKTWRDPGGRTGGRHTSFAPLSNGRILGMGGKSTNIDGYMPKSISDDQGRTWKISKTPLPSLGSNQRPTLIKLQSGRLFFAGDLQRNDGYQPPTIHERGAYVALSDDEGKTWKIKKLPGTLPHESKERAERLKGETLGYSVARQAPNGVIHLITTMNTPCMHFALNEAWILNDDTNNSLTDYSKEENISDVKEYEEYYPSGDLKSKWSAGITGNGRYLLHGKKTTYYPSGDVQWEVNYDMGKKAGEETYKDENGNLIWKWIHKDDGTAVWTIYYKNGRKKTESSWKGKRASGKAYKWNPDGKLVNEVNFNNGFVD